MDERAAHERVEALARRGVLGAQDRGGRGVGGASSRGRRSTRCRYQRYGAAVVVGQRASSSARRAAGAARSPRRRGARAARRAPAERARPAWACNARVDPWRRGGAAKRSSVSWPPGGGGRLGVARAGGLGRDRRGGAGRRGRRLAVHRQAHARRDRASASGSAGCGVPSPGAASSSASSPAASRGASQRIGATRGQRRAEQLVGLDRAADQQPLLGARHRDVQDPALLLGVGLRARLAQRLVVQGVGAGRRRRCAAAGRRGRRRRAGRRCGIRPSRPRSATTTTGNSRPLAACIVISRTAEASPSSTGASVSRASASSSAVARSMSPRRSRPRRASNSRPAAGA